jgi:hypothetical protein
MRVCTLAILLGSAIMGRCERLRLIPMAVR